MLIRSFKEFMPLETIKAMAKEGGFDKVKHQPGEKMISFARGDRDKGDWIRVNVYYTTMTVGTCLNHPTKGKTQLFRRNVDEKMLATIFKRPRVHTRKGYYKK